jgi:protein gp37
MGKNSSIEWTHHTFNPWWGCVKVSPACTHCYAEAWAKRVGRKVWGPRAARRFFTDAHWREPLRWHAEAEKAGTVPRVFCASMADVFEDRADLVEHRARLFRLIERTPRLQWLLLTKRPEHAGKLARESGWGNAWPSNVWAGTTVENQEYAVERIPELIALPARIHFLSCEPLLGPVDLRPWLSDLDWVIAGGESGGKSRPMAHAWPASLRDQCATAGVAFHFKQWGDWAPVDVTMKRLGKKSAGRELDGRTWDGVPEAAIPAKSARTVAMAV